MKKVRITIEVEIPEDAHIESVAVGRDGSVMGFAKYSEPFPVYHIGRWEVSRQYKQYLYVSNWKETITNVD
jgi:hypothetical protein